MERCMSCISKLGAPSMSRSSTDTGMGNSGIVQTQQHPSGHGGAASTTTVPSGSVVGTGLDRMSVCSSHGSFGSNSSEYSVPRMSWCNHSSGSDDRTTSTVQNQTCKMCPPTRPPKATTNANGKAPMPLPNADKVTSVATIAHHRHQSQPQQSVNKFVGSYENYDVPRTSIQVPQKGSTVTVADNYDTPKKFQECLSEDMNCNPAMAPMTTTINAKQNIDIYGNYDVPAIVSDPNTTLGDGGGGGISHGLNENAARVDCTCNKVMSWADSWISIPYCRRGNSIENTGMPINKVRLNGEGKMPVVQPTGELAVYATVDMTKKIKRRLIDDMKMCECSHSDNFTDDNDGSSSSQSSNYINIVPNSVFVSAQQSQDCAACADSDRNAECNDKPTTAKTTETENYMNLDYAMSLRNYENAKEVLQKAGFSVKHIEETLAQCVLHRAVCNKCGHASRLTSNQSCDDSVTTTQPTMNTDVEHANGELKMPEDYILMEPSKSKFPGYLPMSPAAPNTGTALNEIVLTQQIIAGDPQTKAPPLPSKADLMKRLMSDKTGGSPTIGPAVDRSKKRTEQETRISGSAMMSSLNSSSNPYSRKQMMDNGDLLPSHDKRAVFGRKRSSSADSTRLSAISNLINSKVAHRRSVSAIGCTKISQDIEPLPTAKVSPKCPVSDSAASSATLEQRSSAIDTDDEISLSMNQSQTSQQSQQSTVYIRRSASVPCKSQNRDSSSSNDSGVSTGSMRQRNNGEYTEFELPLTTTMSTIRHRRNTTGLQSTLHASLPRRSRSFDPLREITFQFARNGKFKEKSTSAEAEIPICTPKAINTAKGGYVSPNDATSLTGSGHPYIDSRSTSSGTSDMSDYIETLSLSSHSSSDTPEGLR